MAYSSQMNISMGQLYVKAITTSYFFGSHFWRDTNSFFLIFIFQLQLTFNTILVSGVQHSV